VAEVFRALAQRVLEAAGRSAATAPVGVSPA
jgi:hypothetical protein